MWFQNAGHCKPCPAEVWEPKPPGWSPSSSSGGISRRWLGQCNFGRRDLSRTKDICWMLLKFHPFENASNFWNGKNTIPKFRVWRFRPNWISFFENRGKCRSAEKKAWRCSLSLSAGFNSCFHHVFPKLHRSLQVFVPVGQLSCRGPKMDALKWQWFNEKIIWGDPYHMFIPCDFVFPAHFYTGSGHLRHGVPPVI